jgi:hypothetical protein
MGKQQLVGQRGLSYTLEQLSLRGHERLGCRALSQLGVELQLANGKGFDRIAIEPNEGIPLGREETL